MKTPPPNILFSDRTMNMAHQGIEPLFSAEEIADRVDALAASLSDWFDGDPITHVFMNGAMMFASDLTRAMSLAGTVLEMDFIQVVKDRRSKKRELVAASNRPVAGRDVLIIDDIFETGKTLSLAKEYFNSLGAQSVTSVVLLDKSKGRETSDKPDFYGFKCPDTFVIGYGMDLGYRYRELPFIGRLGQA